MQLLKYIIMVENETHLLTVTIYCSNTSVKSSDQILDTLKQSIATFIAS
jgi:hypothetical protein